MTDGLEDLEKVDSTSLFPPIVVFGEMKKKTAIVCVLICFKQEYVYMYKIERCD